MQPPAPAAKPVTETLYGQTVVDPYRYMEQLGPETLDWMRAQGRFTRAFFDSMPGRAKLGQDIAAFTASIVPVNAYQSFGGRDFYEERTPGSDNLDLMVKQPDGRVIKLVDVAALRASHGGAPYAINYFQASPDGAKVAVGVSEGGSEDAVLTVYDAETGRMIGRTLDRAQFGPPSWTGDSRGLFLNRLQVTTDRQAKYLNSKAEYWDLQGESRPLVGAGLPGPVRVDPVQFPFITLAPGSPWAIAMISNGVQNEQEAWIAPAAEAGRADASWRKLVDRSDDVTAIVAQGNDLFLLSHKDAPTFKVLRLKAGRPISEAETLLPARPDRLVESIAAASDGLYVLVREGVYSHLLRIPAEGGPAQEVPLPTKGSIGDVFTDPRAPGVVFTLDSWATPPTHLRYQPQTGRLTDLHLGKPPAFDPNGYVVMDLKAVARDGTEVPLSYVESKSPTRPGIVLLEAYGAYGISSFPSFASRPAFLLQQGAALATCHVRGGGELGERWRLGGKDADKPNTWRDLIACGEALVAGGYATNKTLFIMGGSAGGITMGRAMEERPDLFAGVFDLVPCANPLRMEFSPNGPPNIPEFGSVKTEEGFRNLKAMDSYQHVEDGKRYPPVMITTGLNDPRVDPWQPAKLAARLLASGDPSPVLLRVDETAGHGIGSTKTQNDELFADILSFIFWQEGREGFQPKH